MTPGEGAGLSPPHRPDAAPRAQWHVDVAGRRLRVELDPEGLRVDGEPVDVELSPPSAGPVRAVRIGGRPLRVVARRDAPGRWSLRIGGRRHDVRVMDAVQAAIEAAANSRRGGGGARPGPLRAPMPGLVVEIGTSPGEVVEPGAPLVTLDAMKMENELRAERRGRVAHVLVTRGAPVEKGQLLVTFEDPEAPQ